MRHKGRTFAGATGWPGAVLACLLLLGGCTQTEHMFGEGERAPAVKRHGPPPDLDALMNRDSSALLSAMGDPTLLREEIDVQVWQYEHPACVMFFYLYRNGDDQFTVSHIEARAATGGAMDAQTCIAEQWGKA